jgi:hypothetical protein
MKIANLQLIAPIGKKIQRLQKRNKEEIEMW